MIRTTLDVVWQVGPAADAVAEPERLVPAAIPGAVQLDWARAHGWPSHTIGLEPERYAGLEDRWWAYRCTLPGIPDGSSAPWLILAGVDHACTVRLDGQVIAEHAGLQVPLEVALDGAHAGSQLEVRIHPAPKAPGRSGRFRAHRTTKPAVSYGWDFHPELIPLGLWRPVRIEMRPATYLAEVVVRHRLDAAMEAADLAVGIDVAGAGRVIAELVAPDGRTVWSAERQGSGGLGGRLAQPQLWWPAGHGAQAVYRLIVRLFDAQGRECDRRERPLGFRRVRLEMAPGQWDHPSEFPKSRSRPPMMLTVNGRRIFAKGANVAPLDIFPGAITAAHAAEIVRIAAAAHMNMLRVWGGGPAPLDAFYDACDAAGVMVLQEFPLACADYVDDDAYLKVLHAEARAMVGRLASHPCLAVWCGGNELFNAWSGMTDQSLALRTLNMVTLALDPDTPFLPTLPVEGVGHGHYLFRDPRNGEEVYQVYARATNTALTEFGVPGPADAEVIRSVLLPGEHWPPRLDGAWKLHGGAGAWDVEPSSWLCQVTIERYFGPCSDLDDLVAKGQWLQSAGLTCIFEEARRQRPRCGWALSWCLNEPWPNVANSSLLSWPARPKPALAAVGQALRPTLASARIPRFQWQGGEAFSAELFLLHDAPASAAAGTVEVWLSSGTWRERLLAWEHAALPADRDLAGPTVRCTLPERLGEDLVLELICSDPARSSRYRLATRQFEATAAGPRGLNA
jgi:beta-mannosidase